MSVSNILDSARSLEFEFKTSILHAFTDTFGYIVEYAAGFLSQACPFAIRQMSFRIFGGLLMLTETH